jgi:hypothetical protein
MGLDLHTERPESSTCNVLTIRRQYHQQEELQTLVCIMSVLKLTTITQVCCTFSYLFFFLFCFAHSLP